MILSICTTTLNGMEGRWLSVEIAIVALIGLCLLLFKQMRLGYCIMCGCNLLAFIVGAYQGIQGGTDMFLSVLMSFIGSALIPVVTFFFIFHQWKELK